MDGEDVNFVPAHQPVNDSVGRLNDFTDRGVSELWDYAARLGERHQAISRRNEARDDHPGIVRRILADEGANRGQVGLCLRRPANRPHDKNCFLTSSWETSWRASDCRRPSSTFATKHSRSIASSIVACSGNVRSASMARCFSVTSMSTILPSSCWINVCGCRGSRRTAPPRVENPAP